jgi:hypothetical protein
MKKVNEIELWIMWKFEKFMFLIASWGFVGDQWAHEKFSLFQFWNPWKTLIHQIPI